MVETNRDSHQAFVRALSEGEQILVYFKDTCLSPEARDGFYGHFLILDVVDKEISLLEYFISHFKSDTKGACSKFQELQNLGLGENVSHIKLRLIHYYVSLIVKNVDLRQQIAAFTDNNERLKAENDELAASNSDLKVVNAQLIDRKAWLVTRNEALTTRHDDLLDKHAKLIARNEQLTASYEALTTKHAELSARNAELIARNEQLLADNDNLAARNTVPTTAPDEFKCPITLETMEDPVFISTGYSYERDAIWKWFEQGLFTCPATGLPVLEVVTKKSDLVPNIRLRQLIQDWRVTERSLESTAIATAAAVAPNAAQTAQAMHAEAYALARPESSAGADSVGADSDHAQYPAAQPGGIVLPSDEVRGLQGEGDEVVQRNLHLQLMTNLGAESAPRLQLVEEASRREREAEEKSRRDRERRLVLNRFLQLHSAHVRLSRMEEEEVSRRDRERGLVSNRSLLLHEMSVSPAREAVEVSAERQAHQDSFRGTLAAILDVGTTGRLGLLVADDARLARAREERVRNYNRQIINYHRQSLFRTYGYPENNRSSYSAGSGYDSDTLRVD